MKAVADIVIALADLIEAESRELRRGFYRRGLVFVAIAAVAFLTIAGLAFLLVALRGTLIRMAGEEGGAALTGMLALAAAGGVAWIAKRAASSR